MSLPNILFLHAHAVGRYVQPYGHPVRTPRLQRLAEEGMLFRRAFCASPSSSPSLACLFTGTYAHCNGMVGLAERGFKLNDPGQCLCHALREAGYATVLAGAQRLANGLGAWRDLGYSVCLGEESDVDIAAARFLEGGPTQPFFLCLNFEEIQRPFHPPGPAEDPRYILPPAPLPDTGETRWDVAGFKASARALDERVGRILDGLERGGLVENTLVICTTDHGPAFPRMECHLHDSGIGVMLIMRGPGGFEGGRVCEALVSHLDIFPTLCELTGLERRSWLRGYSMLPLVRGEGERIREEVRAEINYHVAYDPQRSIRTARWKYIRRYGDHPRRIVSNCSDGPSKSLWIERGWQDTPPFHEQLFDLVFDPGEMDNLSENPERRDTLNDMRQRLRAWIKETDDPIIRGGVSVPEGARIGAPGAVSAE